MLELFLVKGLLLEVMDFAFPGCVARVRLLFAHLVELGPMLDKANKYLLFLLDLSRTDLIVEKRFWVRDIYRSRAAIFLWNSFLFY